MKILSLIRDKLNKYDGNKIFLLLLFFVSSSTYADVIFDIKGVQDSQVKTNLSLFLKGLSQPQDANNENYLTEVKQVSKQSLLALGYYQPKITTSVIHNSEQQVVQLTLDLGLRTRINEVNLTLTGEALHDKNFQQYLLNFPIQKGDFLNHSDYELAKNKFITLAQQYGYFDAKYLKSSVQVTQQQHQANIQLWFDSGIRYQFGDLIFDTETPAEKFIYTLQNFQYGDPFDVNKLNQFNQDLNETGYFKSITILPDLTNKTSTRKVPLHVMTAMRAQDSFNTGIGYSTDEGVRGKFRWIRPWVNHYGHSIEANLVASTYKQEASLTYNIPLEDPLYNYLSFQSGYKNLDQNDTDTTQYITSLNRHWRLDNNWLRTLYVRYDNESGTQGQQIFDSELILPGISFGRTRSRGGVNVYWGDRQLVYAEFATEKLLSTHSLFKIYGQNKIIRTYNGHQFISSIEAGAIFADSIYDVPSSMRFFTGGDQSIRGYGYEEIAPTDSDDYLIGGLYLVTASLEYRYPFTQHWKAALFSDTGTATDDFSESLSSSVGGGVVWSSPVGPIRFYVAKPLVNSVDNVKFHLMIGPEL